MKYVIKLPNRKGYLCHTGTNRAVIYDSPTEYPIGFDIAVSKGKRLPLEGDALKEIYLYGWYDNQIEEIEDPVESLNDFRGMPLGSDEPTVYIREETDF
jgi:hypothetical protein